MLPLMMLMMQAAKNPQQWGPILDSLGPSFGPSQIVPALNRMSAGGDSIFATPTGGLSDGPQTSLPSNEAAGRRGSRENPFTEQDMVRAQPGDFIFSGGNLTQVPANGGVPDIVQRGYQPSQAPNPNKGSTQYGYESPTPAPVSSPASSLPPSSPPPPTDPFDSIARQALGLAPTGMTGAGAFGDGMGSGGMMPLMQTESMLNPPPGNLMPSPLSVGAPDVLAAALNAGRPPAAPDPITGASLFAPPSPAPLLSPSGPPPIGGPPPLSPTQVPPQVKSPTAPNPVFSGGVTGAQKAPELGVQMSAGGTPAQLLLQAIMSASRPDPLRVPLLNSLFGG